MTDWVELESRFRELGPRAEQLRLDHQWGDIPEHWSLAGPGDRLMRERYRALAIIAGQLVLDSPDLRLPLGVRQPDDAEETWYRCVWHLVGPSEPPTLGTMVNEGKPAGNLFLGNIFRLAEASALAALRLQAASSRAVQGAVSPASALPAPGAWARFWEKYGVPIIIGIMATVAGGLLLAWLL